MTRRTFSLLTAGSAAAHAASAFLHHENVLGTSFAFRASGTPDQSRRAEAAALAEIDRLTEILSAYNPASEFSIWAATPPGRPVRVSHPLRTVLSLYDSWQSRTHGAINAAAHTPGIPGVQRPHWRIHPDGRVSRLSTTPLKLNSFTKGFILDKAVAAARQHAPGVVLNSGGDIVVAGDITQTIHIANPFHDTDNSTPLATTQISNRAIATSGNSRRGAHIINPATRQPATHIAAATVAAPNAVTAGALATAFNVLPVTQSRPLAEPAHADYLIVESNGQRHASDSWRSMAFQAQTAPADTPVLIALELARISDGRYRRPFVAVWIEDKDKFPVRTLALWFDKDRWLPDLRAWYRGDRLRSLAEGNSIAGAVSSPTRAPGRYTLHWDGKDNAGKPVKPGKYFVSIEAAREHGTYQILRQDIDFPGAPKQIPLTGGTEIASANIEIRKPR